MYNYCMCTLTLYCKNELFKILFELICEDAYIAILWII